MRTPRLDRFFDQGMTFNNFYSNCPVCSPARAAAMTGRYPDLVGVPGVIRTHDENSWGYLSQNAVTLPQLLKQLGYDTALIGKWHLGLRSENHPNERGFDFFHGFLGDMMDDYYDHLRHGNNYMRKNRETIKPEGHATDLFTEWTIDYLKSHANSENPWFLFLSYNAPHTPIQPPEDWLERVEQRERDIPEARAKLVALIEHMDHGIGQVLDNLPGAPEDTLVLFVSDNGGQLNVKANCGLYRSGKQSMYEGGIRVPFAARWPDQIAAQSRSQSVQATMDILPTLCELTGAPTPRLTDGASFLNELLQRNDADSTDPRTLIFVRREGGGQYLGQDYYAIRHGDWKLLHDSPFQPYELYNIAEDPYEQTNVAEQNPAVFQELTRSLQRHIQRAGAVIWQKP